MLIVKSYPLIAVSDRTLCTNYAFKYCSYRIHSPQAQLVPGKLKTKPKLDVTRLRNDSMNMGNYGESTIQYCTACYTRFPRSLCYSHEQSWKFKPTGMTVKFGRILLLDWLVELSQKLIILPTGSLPIGFIAVNFFRYW